MTDRPAYKVNDPVLVPHGIGTLVGRIQELYGDRAVLKVDFGTITVPLSEISPTPALEGRWRLDEMSEQVDLDMAAAQRSLDQRFKAEYPEEEVGAYRIGYMDCIKDMRILKEAGVPLPTEDGHIKTSAEYGEVWMVKVEYNTDFDGREIDPGKEEYPCTFHGEFFSEQEADEWLMAYPDDTDVHEITIVNMNRVRPA